MMLFTSGWFGSPTTTTAYPSRLKVLACSWAFVTKGQVASTIVTPFPSSAARSERVTPWERMITFPQEISSTVSTTRTPFS